MQDAGLYFVYMGLESGTEEGLGTLNKEITVEQNLRAVASSRRSASGIEFGFMLFDPSTHASNRSATISNSSDDHGRRQRGDVLPDAPL